MDHTGWRSRGYLPHCDGAGIIHHLVISTLGASEGIEKHFGVWHFADPRAATIVEDALLHFDGVRYRALAWCVMPNHAHAVLEQAEGWPLSSIAHSWKSFTANAVNKAVGRTGPLRTREYFDRFMRDDDHLSTTIAYVENNPVTAGLAGTVDDWQWSSARRRRTSKA